MMVAYMIARIKVTDMEQYKEYMKLTPEIIEKFGGKFIARGGEVLTLEGEAETNRVVILEFPSSEQIQAWYDSPEYQHAISVREGAAIAQFVVVDGV
jgi:uncharacterized protein (DUF1330 family)